MEADHKLKFVFSIPTEAVGLIIGKSGKNLLKISQDSKSKVSLQSHHDVQLGSHERIVIVEGDKSSIMQALRMVVPTLIDRKSSSSSEEIKASDSPPASDTESVELIKWLIPQQMCGVLIGKGGDGIKAINTQSGAWVKIAHVEEASPGAEERLVYIRGTKSQCENALNMVRDIARGRAFDSTQNLSTILSSFPDVSLKTDTTPGYDFSVHLSVPVLSIGGAFTEAIESNYFCPTPRVNIIIDPHFDFRFPAAIKVQIRGTTTTVCNEVKTVLFNCSQHILRSLKPPKEEVKTGNALADLLIGSLAKGNTIVLKILLKADFFNFLTSVRSEDNVGIFDSLKKDFKADLIHIPTLQKFSTDAPSLVQCFFICREDHFFEGIEALLGFMSSVKGCSPLEIPIQSNILYQSIVGVKKLASEMDYPVGLGAPHLKKMAKVPPGTLTGGVDQGLGLPPFYDPELYGDLDQGNFGFPNPNAHIHGHVHPHAAHQGPGLGLGGPYAYMPSVHPRPAVGYPGPPPPLHPQTRHYYDIPLDPLPPGPPGFLDDFGYYDPTLPVGMPMPMPLPRGPYGGIHAYYEHAMILDDEFRRSEFMAHQADQHMGMGMGFYPVRGQRHLAVRPTQHPQHLGLHPYAHAPGPMTGHVPYGMGASPAAVARDMYYPPSYAGTARGMMPHAGGPYALPTSLEQYPVFDPMSLQLPMHMQSQIMKSHLGINASSVNGPLHEKRF